MVLFRIMFRRSPVVPCGTVLSSNIGQRPMYTRIIIEALTFSKPKNLSLPSGLTGPATSARCFSSGVGWGAFGSFFAGVEWALELFWFWTMRCQPGYVYQSSAWLPIIREVRRVGARALRDLPSCF